MLLFQVVHGLLLLGKVQDKAYPEKKEKNIFKLLIFKREVQKLLKPFLQITPLSFFLRFDYKEICGVEERG